MLPALIWLLVAVLASEAGSQPVVGTAPGAAAPSLERLTRTDRAATTVPSAAPPPRPPLDTGQAAALAAAANATAPARGAAPPPAGDASAAGNASLPGADPPDDEHSGGEDAPLAVFASQDPRQFAASLPRCWWARQATTVKQSLVVYDCRVRRARARGGRRARGAPAACARGSGGAARARARRRRGRAPRRGRGPGRRAGRLRSGQLLGGPAATPMAPCCQPLPHLRPSPFPATQVRAPGLDAAVAQLPVQTLPSSYIQ